MVKILTRDDKREALDRILEAVKREIDPPTLTAEDCAAWIVYAIRRASALSTTLEFEEDNPGEKARWRIQDEIEDQIGMMSDGDWREEDLIDSVASELGKELDPDYGAIIDPDTFNDWLE